MSYIDLTPAERDTFIRLQRKGLRSPSMIAEMRQNWPRSPSAENAERLARSLVPAHREIVDKVWRSKWNRLP